MYDKLSKLILVISAASVMLTSGPDGFNLSAASADMKGMTSGKLLTTVDPYQEPPVPKNLPVYVPPKRRPRQQKKLKIKPLIETKHMAIHQNWMYQKVFSTQQLRDWAARMDKAYEAYVDWVGKDLPLDKILIDLTSLEPYKAGEAFQSRFIIINKDLLNSTADNLDEIGRHELGHIFGVRQAWYHDEESIADFFDYYVSGIDRRGRYRAAAASYAENPNQMSMFGDKGDLAAGDRSDYSGKNSAYDFYLFGLVEKVGWDAYKKAFHSFQNEPRNGPVSPRDLFNRVADGNTDILRSLPDKGALLDKFFPEESKPKYAEHSQRPEHVTARPRPVQPSAPRRKRGDRPRGMRIED